MKSLIIDSKQKNNNLLFKKKQNYKEFKKDFRERVRLRGGRERDRSRSREGSFMKNKTVQNYSSRRREKKFLELRVEESEDSNSEFEEKKEIKKNLKDDVMKIINTQNFIEGFWSENEQTKKIKKNYQKEFDLIKKLNNKKINDNVAITVIIIYFIYKEHSYLLKELSRIIKKAKLYIKKETNSSYEDIIKQIGI